MSFTPGSVAAALSVTVEPSIAVAGTENSVTVGQTLLTVKDVYADGAVTRAITVDLTDEDGTFTDRAKALSVAVNATPTGITLTGNSVTENQPSGTAVGTFSTTDPDAGDSFTYRLVDGTGGDDNRFFTIDAGANLRTAAGFDFEAKPACSIRVRSTDAGGLFTEQTFTVSVTNANDAPAVAVPAAQTAYEDVDKAISGITVGDQDGGSLSVKLAVRHGTLTLAKTTGLTAIGNGTGALKLSGSIADLNASLARLTYRGGLNYGGADTLSITAGDGSLSTNAAVSITVKSAAQQAADLRGQVNVLRTARVLKKSQAEILISHLRLSGTVVDIRTVSLFLADVARLRSAGVLTQAQADALLGPGNVLLRSLKRPPAAVATFSIVR